MPCAARRPLKIVLTGLPAAGKSTFLRAFEELGCPTFSADEVVRSLSRPCQKGYHRLLACFGEEILTAAGELDRRKILQRMLKDASFKEKLEEILHPLVKAELLSWFEKNREASFLVAEIPLLFQAGWEDLFDLVIFLTCPRETLLARLRERLGDEKLARALLESYEKGLPPRIEALKIAGDLPQDRFQEKAREILSKNGI